MVARVEVYPAYSLAVTGEQAPAGAFTVLQALRPAPFNLVMSQGAIVIVPRSVEQPSGFASPFGGLEMAGCVGLGEEDHYRKLAYDEVHKALAECGWFKEEGKELEEKISRAWPRPEKVRGTGKAVRWA